MMDMIWGLKEEKLIKMTFLKSRKYWNIVILMKNFQVSKEEILNSSDIGLNFETLSETLSHQMIW